MIEIFDDKIVLEIEYDGEEILRPILLIMRRTPWYERILKAPSGLIINFLLVLFVLYFLGWLSVISAALAFLFSVALTGIISLYIFAWLGRVATFLEHKYRAKFKNIPRPKYKYILDNTGIRKVSSRDVELSEWTEIKGAFETEQDILLSHYHVNAYYFPKRIFQTFDEMVYFKNFIRQRIGNRADF